MYRRPFLMFIACVAALVTAMLAVLQSPRFAGWVKHRVVSRLPESFGVELDFKRFDLRVFPPGVSLLEPAVVLAENNLADAPSGRISAERISINFYPLQMFSGRITIHEVEIENGKVDLDVDPERLTRKRAKKTKTTETAVTWEDLLRIRIDAVRISNAALRFEVKSKALHAVEMNAKRFEVSKWNGVGGLGYETALDVRDLRLYAGADSPLPSLVPELILKAQMNPVGLVIEEASVRGEGVEFESSGSFKGNLLLGQKLPGEVKLKLKGDFGKIADWLTGATSGKKSKVDDRPIGSFEFEGSAAADLFEPKRTLSVDGKFSGNAFRYQGWNADQWRAEARWSSQPGNPAGMIQLKSAYFQSVHSPRVPPHTPAVGGKLRIGAFTYSGQIGEMVRVPLEFEDAHIHWLMGGAGEGVFPLDFRTTGSVTAEVTPAKDLSKSRVSAVFKLAIPDFTFDNQKKGRIRSRNRTVVAKDVRVEGKADLGPSGIFLNDVKLSMPRTKFSGKGQITDKGIDILMVGPTDLSDLQILAESQPRGKGMVSTRIHGPSDKLFMDWDFDLEDAGYINLDMGNVKGRISLEDERSILRFENIRGKKNITAYEGSGLIDLIPDKIDIKVAFSRGDVQDLSRIFAKLIEKVSWAPRAMQGEMRGTISVSGGTASKDLIVIGDLHGTDWSYWGERFRKVELKGGYDRGDYFVERLHAVKQVGSFEGSVRYTSAQELTWNLRSSGLLLSDFDLFSRFDVPVRGNVDVRSVGKGKSGAYESSSSIDVNEARIRGVPLPRSSLRIQTENKIARIRGSVFDGQATLELDHGLIEGQASRLKAQANRFDFTPFLYSINARLLEDSSLRGTLSGDIDLRYDSGSFERASGMLRFRSYDLARSGFSYSLKHSIEAEISKGTFEIQDLEVREGSNAVSLQLQSRSGQIDGRIKGKTSLGFLELVAPVLSEAQGTILPDLRLAGTLLQPELHGELRVDAPLLRIGSMETPVENVKADIAVKGSVVRLKRVEARLGRGGVLGSGDIELFIDRAPKLKFDLTFDRARPKLYPFQYVRVSGPISISGSELPYVVKGSLICDQAFSNLNFNRNLGGRGSSGLYMPKSGVGQDAGLPIFKLDIDVTANRGLVWKNDLIDGEWKGQFKIIHTIEAPRVLGEADLVQGRMNFNDRQFALSTLRVTFDNPTVVNPKFTLAGVTEVRNVKVNLLAYGTADQIKIDLSSSPVLPESEILSLLAVGAVSQDFQGGARAGNRSTLSSGEAATAILNSLNFNRDIQDKTGLRIQLDEAVNNMYGNSIFRPNAFSDQSASPKIVIRREIGRRFNLALGSTFGVGSNTQQELNAEYRLTPGASVIGVWNNFEQVNTGDRQTSFGFDLRLQKRFE